MLSPRHEAEIVGYFRRERSHLISLLDHPPRRFVGLLSTDPRLLQIPVDVAPLGVESKPHGLEVKCAYGRIECSTRV